MVKPEKVLTDELWGIIEPLLPKEKPLGTPGRPQVPNRRAMLNRHTLRALERHTMELGPRGLWFWANLLEEA